MAAVGLAGVRKVWVGSALDDVSCTGAKGSSGRSLCCFHQI